jgi:hypothetical protein
VSGPHQATKATLYANKAACWLMLKKWSNAADDAAAGLRQVCAAVLLCCCAAVLLCCCAAVLLCCCAAVCLVL